MNWEENDILSNPVLAALKGMCIWTCAQGFCFLELAET